MKTLMENFQRYTQTFLNEALNAKSNLKTVPAKTIVQGLLSADEQHPIILAIKGFSTDGKNAAEIKAWAEEIGAKNLLARIAKVQELIPTEAPAKDEMPALEPTDAQKVKDALDDTGGEYGIDFNNPRFADEEEEELAERSIKPDFNDPRFPSQHTQGNKEWGDEYLTRGLRDPQKGDDKISVVSGKPLVVGKMLPTQSNILLGKSLWFAINLIDSGAIDALEGFATTNGEILDGHHRWSGQYIGAGPTKSLTDVTLVDAPVEVAIPMLRSIGNAFGNAQKS